MCNFIYFNIISDVDIATSQNDVRFVNIEGLGNIRINVQQSDNQSIAYIRLYINDAIENQTIIMVGPLQVEVMSCNSTYCAHETFLTTGPNRHLSQVGENYSLELNSSTTILLQSGRFTKLALMSIAGNASFKNVPQKDIVPQFVNNPKEQIEFVNVIFQLTTPLINQSEGSPPTTAPRDGYPVLAPLVQKYSNSLSKAMPGASNEECLTDCYCPCAWVAEPKNYTQNEIQTMVAAIQEKLKVSLKNLTSTYRKLNSMPDNRPSAKAVGVVGMIFLVLTLGTIFVVDIGNIIRDLKTLCDNLRQGFGCKEASPKPSRVASPHDTVEQSTSV
ncbi:uncharacterized protein LOC127858336 isoform X1 [Dreissena polymorpha]|uniref:uncharacterized protein LOC127858336 isoform X1 n=1 Tax=Dreissena polymorpha TaxID=45954 RepID=UPI00226431B5|nr:uncharacterized protein LOC127858336 isoform X1 [Dreissena polymorpha]